MFFRFNSNQSICLLFLLQNTSANTLHVHVFISHHPPPTGTYSHVVDPSIVRSFVRTWRSRLRGRQKSMQNPKRTVFSIPPKTLPKRFLLPRLIKINSQRLSQCPLHILFGYEMRAARHYSGPLSMRHRHRNEMGAIFSCFLWKNFATSLRMALCTNHANLANLPPGKECQEGAEEPTHDLPNYIWPRRVPRLGGRWFGWLGQICERRVPCAAHATDARLFLLRGGRAKTHADELQRCEHTGVWNIPTHR